MYSTYNEGKSVVAETFIRTLKKRIFKYMAAVSKNVYISVLDDIVNKYSKIVHRSIKMKLIDVTPDSYAECNEDSNDKDPKFKVGDHVRIQNTKTFLLKDTLQMGQKKFLLLVKLKIQLRGHVIRDLNGEPIIGSIYEKELQKTSQEKFRIENVLKRKGDKLYVKWKGYDNSFNSWIDKKDLE